MKAKARVEARERSSSGGELDRLLEESRESAARRVAAHRLSKKVPLVLYGAGNLGCSTVRRLRQAGVRPAAFADDTPGKQGETIEGVPVMSPGAALAAFGPEAIFVVTIHNPAASFLALRARLRRHADLRVISFPELAWSYPDVLLPYLWFDLPQRVLAKAPDIRRAFDLLADEESRRQFVAHLKFRLWLDFESLPAAAPVGLVPDVIAPLADNVTFVDCGAFDGDTIRIFLSGQNGRFGHIIAFEPDARNYQQLLSYVDGLDEQVRHRIATSQAAVGARRERLSFSATGDAGATLSGAGNAEVDVLPLHEVIPRDATQLFIKVDVEGAEDAALNGAIPVLQQRPAIVALSVYHRPDDLWQLPFRLHSINPGSQLFIRSLGNDGMDVVCFAVPQGMASSGAACTLQ
jgi:FkbM family methyltransferase